MKSKNSNTSIDVALGKRLRFFRLARGKSQTDVASAIGVSFQQLQKYERGSNRLSVESMIRIARFLKVNPVEFIITDLDEDSESPLLTLPPQADQLQLLQHYANISDPAKRKAVVKIAQWLR